MRRAARVDKNQPAVVQALREIGAEVTHLHQLGGGVSDLLVSFRQRWFVMEVKSEDGDLSQDQREWIGKQRAPVYVVKSPEQAVEFLQEFAADWLLALNARASQVRTHICEGPGLADDDMAPEEPHERPALLIDRVLDALKASWRAHEKLCEDELCERLGASKTSKRVEKALRELCRRGLAHREGNNRRAMYWPATTEGST